MWKRYDTGRHKIEALKGIDLVVRRGEVVAMLTDEDGGPRGVFVELHLDDLVEVMVGAAKPSWTSLRRLSI